MIMLLGVVACDSHQTTESLIKPIPIQHDQAETAKKLTDIAGQSVILEDVAVPNSALKAHERAFVGRYHVSIPCDDDFVPCTEGMAEYILNLGADGSVHRSIVQYGKVFTEKTRAEFSNVNYRRDTWSVDLEAAELIVHHREGIDFYYHIKDQRHLVMKLEKMNDGQNRKLLKNGYPRPAKAYELVKDD